MAALALKRMHISTTGERLPGTHLFFQIVLGVVVLGSLVGLYQSAFSLSFTRTLFTRSIGWEYWYGFWLAGAMLCTLSWPRLAQKMGLLKRITACLFGSMLFGGAFWAFSTFTLPFVSLAFASECYAEQTTVAEKVDRPFRRRGCRYLLYGQAAAESSGQKLCVSESFWEAVSVGDVLEIEGIVNEFAKKANSVARRR